MPMINAETVVRRNDDVFTGVVDNETVAMNVQNGKYYHLNETGSRIFSLLEESRSLQAICAELKKQFQADDVTMLRDVTDFIREMSARGLIVIP